MIEGSILTNTPAKTALNVLGDTKESMANTQEKISTGKKVNEAMDGPSSFVTAKTMKSDVAVFKKMEENLGLNKQLMNVASTNAEKVNGFVEDIKQSVTDAYNGAKPSEEVSSDIDTFRNQIQNLVEGSQFNGVNMLNERGEQKMLMSLNRGAGDADIESNTLKANKHDLNVTTPDGGLSMLQNVAVEGLGDNGEAVNIDNGTTTASTVDLANDKLVAGQTMTVTAHNSGTTQTETITLVNNDVTVKGSKSITTPTQMEDGSWAINLDNMTSLTSGKVGAKIASVLASKAGGVFGTTAGSSTLGVQGATTTSKVSFTNTDSSVRVDSISSGFNHDIMMDKVERAQNQALDASSEFGSVKQRLETQQEFVGSLKDTLDTGVGEIVDANMTEQAAKLKALQAQQQLGNRALSIANRNPQSLLSAFGG